MKCNRIFGGAPVRDRSVFTGRGRASLTSFKRGGGHNKFLSLYSVGRGDEQFYPRVYEKYLEASDILSDLY